MLIYNDSAYDYSHSKFFESLTRVYDQHLARGLKGFKLLTFSWSWFDGNRLWRLISCLAPLPKRIIKSKESPSNSITLMWLPMATRSDARNPSIWKR